MRLASLATLAALCLTPTLPVAAQEASVRGTIGAVPLTGPVASLFVLNARGATLADGKLTLTGVAPSSIAFADRPVRAAGHIETAQFVDDWRKGEDDADIDPPNATISVLDDANVSDAVVTISKPALSGDTLILDDLKRRAQPGYPAIGRLKGLAELRGVTSALSHAELGLAQ